VTTQATTKENINKLIGFRQAVYENGMLRRRDALFDLLDAPICEGTVASFARLSQSERFVRKWLSLYAAVEDGELDSQWLRTYLAGQVPQSGICVFPLDVQRVPSTQTAQGVGAARSKLWPSPARPPKTRGNALGWQKGKLRTHKQRHAVVKKTPVAVKTA
jgi:hypothetical protein